MTPVENQGRTWNKAKAVVALLPYAVWRERGGDNRMLNACSAIIIDERGRESMAQPIVRLLGEEDFDFPNWIVTLVSPYAHWRSFSAPINTNAVIRWAAAALAVPYTEEVCQGVIDTLLKIAYNYRLQPSIPVEIWAWLKKGPSLPPKGPGQRFMGTDGHIVRGVRKLGDVEILESYFLVVWSEWEYLSADGLSAMCTSMREDFGGIGMWRHRDILIKRLDHILGELGRGYIYFIRQDPYYRSTEVQRASEEYGELREVLLDVDRGALETLTRTPFIYSFDLFTPADVHRIPLDVHLCTTSPVSIVARLQHLLFVLPTQCLSHTSVLLYYSFSSTIVQLFKRMSPGSPTHEKCVTLISFVEGGSAGGRVARVIGFCLSTVLYNNLSLRTSVLLCQSCHLTLTFVPHDSR